MLGGRRFLTMLLILGFALGLLMHAWPAAAHGTASNPVVADHDRGDADAVGAGFVACPSATAILQAVPVVAGDVAAPLVEDRATLLQAVIQAPEPYPPKALGPV